MKQSLKALLWAKPSYDPGFSNATPMLTKKCSCGKEYQTKSRRAKRCRRCSAIKRKRKL